MGLKSTPVENTLKIPPERTIVCGVRWHPSPISETANTIHSCSNMLKHGKVCHIRSGQISWAQPLKVPPEGL